LGEEGRTNTLQEQKASFLLRRGKVGVHAGHGWIKSLWFGGLGFSA